MSVTVDYNVRLQRPMFSKGLPVPLWVIMMLLVVEGRISTKSCISGYNIVEALQLAALSGSGVDDFFKYKHNDVMWGRLEQLIPEKVIEEGRTKANPNGLRIIQEWDDFNHFLELAHETSNYGTVDDIPLWKKYASIVGKLESDSGETHPRLVAYTSLGESEMHRMYEDACQRMCDIEDFVSQNPGNHTKLHTLYLSLAKRSSKLQREIKSIEMVRELQGRTPPQGAQQPV